jgi:hypothetical protein
VYCVLCLILIYISLSDLVLSLFAYSALLLRSVAVQTNLAAGYSDEVDDRLPTNAVWYWCHSHDRFLLCE